MTSYLGIDPGKSGAVARVPDLRTWRTPLDSEREYDLQAMKRVLLEAIGDGPAFVIIERAQSMPRFKSAKKYEREDVCPRCNRAPTAGTAGMFDYGAGWGYWIGILIGLGFVEGKNFIRVHPKRWTNMMIKGAPGQGKDRSIWTAKKRFPEWRPRNKSEELALCDAILLAEYGRIIQTHVVFSKAGELDLEYA